MDIVKVFGTNLKRYRTDMGLSQEAFADKCGMHRTYRLCRSPHIPMWSVVSCGSVTQGNL